MRLIRWLGTMFITAAAATVRGVGATTLPSASGETANSYRDSNSSSEMVIRSLDELLAAGNAATRQQQTANESCGRNCDLCLEKAAPEIAELTLQLLEANDGETTENVQLAEEGPMIALYPKQAELLRKSRLPVEALRALLLMIVNRSREPGALEATTVLPKVAPRATVVDVDKLAPRRHGSERSPEVTQGELAAGPPSSSELPMETVSEGWTAPSTGQTWGPTHGATSTIGPPTTGVDTWSTGTVDVVEVTTAPLYGSTAKLPFTYSTSYSSIDSMTEGTPPAFPDDSTTMPEVKIDVTPDHRILVTLPNGVVYPVPRSLDSLIAAADPRQLKIIVARLKELGLPVKFQSNHVVMDDGSGSNSDALRIELVVWSANGSANSVAVYLGGNRFQLPEQMDAFAKQLRIRPRADIRAALNGLQRLSLPQGLDLEPLIHLMDEQDQATTVTTLLPDIVEASTEVGVPEARLTPTGLKPNVSSPGLGRLITGRHAPYRLAAQPGSGGIVLEAAGRRFRLPDDLELLNDVIGTPQGRQSLLQHLRKVGVPAAMINGRLVADQTAITIGAKARKRPVRLRIHTLDGKPNKISIQAEGLDFELPKDQILFNQFIGRSPVLTYEIIKVLSHYNIPVTFDDVTGDLHVRLQDYAPGKNSTNYQVTINGEQYSLPSQWSQLASAIRRGAARQPGQLADLFARYHIEMPQHVLDAIAYARQHNSRLEENPPTISIAGGGPQASQLVLSWRGRRFTLPQDSQKVSRLFTDEDSLTEFRDIALSAGALTHRDDETLWVQLPGGPAKLDLNLSQTPAASIRAGSAAERYTTVWRFMPYNVSRLGSPGLLKVDVADGSEHVLPGGEKRLESTVQKTGKVSRLVDALWANGVGVQVHDRHLYLSWDQSKSRLNFDDKARPYPSFAKGRRRLRIQARGVPGNFTYTITLADGRLVTLPSQWEELREIVRDGKLRLSVLLRLLDMPSIHIEHSKLPNGSLAVTLNGQLYTLNDTSSTAQHAPSSGTESLTAKTG